MVGIAHGQGALSPEEGSLARYIDQHNQEAIELLKRVVNVNSGTENFAGVRQVGAIFRAEFDAMGFQTRWVDGASWNRAGHLVAKHRGVGPRLLLIGHLDTVFAPDSPFQKYEAIDEKTARGPGIIDMKGGDVIIVQALKALDAAGLLKNMNVCAVMTGDEEAYLSIDGQVGMPMYDGDRILCRKSDNCVQLLRLKKTFFDVLRTKLKWGQR